MFSFESFLDLPLIWACIIALAIYVYVVLDGFDLGVGILFPFAPSEECRRRMLNSIAPFWDGNETWLVLGGGGLLVAFPLAYSIIFPAFYIPLIAMLIALVFRGVAFEFHYKSTGNARFFWDHAFHFGSLFAAFAQGVMLGAFVQGIPIIGQDFVGSPFSWASPFSMMTGVALVMGYALLGSTWLVMKTDAITQEWARKVSKYVVLYVIIFMSFVSLSVPFLNEEIYSRWFTWPSFAYLVIIPVIAFILSIWLIQSIRRGKESQPFLLTVLLFTISYIGLAVSLYPWIVPHVIPYWEAAATPETQSLMLVGVVLILPIVIAYTAFNYYVFRGKSSHEDVY